MKAHLTNEAYGAFDDLAFNAVVLCWDDNGEIYETFIPVCVDVEDDGTMVYFRQENDAFEAFAIDKLIAYGMEELRFEKSETIKKFGKKAAKEIFKNKEAIHCLRLAELKDYEDNMK